MKRNTLFLQGVCLLTSIMVLLGVTSCGTIMYPERRGQTAGQMDVGVVVLDGIGLLFFLVPGVIAFAVDFGTGAIYLPPDHPESESDVGPCRRGGASALSLSAERAPGPTHSRVIGLRTRGARRKS